MFQSSILSVQVREETWITCKYQIFFKKRDLPHDSSWRIFDICRWFKFLPWPSAKEPILGSMNCPKRSDGPRVTRATVETKPNVQTYHRIQVFLRNSIFCVLWPKKIIWTPKTLFGLRNLTFWGVILLKLFYLSHGLGDFHCWLCQKIAVLLINYSLDKKF